MSIVPSVPGLPISSYFSGNLDPRADLFDKLIAAHTVIIFRDTMSRDEQVACSMGGALAVEIADEAERGTRSKLASLLTVIEGDVDAGDFDQLTHEIRRAFARHSRSWE